jgi:hypothetical protein
MSAFGLVSRSLVAVTLLTAISACTSTDTKGALDLGAKADASAPQPAVIQGACPAIFLRDGTAYRDVYLNGAKVAADGSKDQSKLMYQASIAETNRQCKLTPNGMIITVQAAGRLVNGPAAPKGTVKLPIRVVVTDETNVLYSELTQYEAALPTNEPSTQFLFTKTDVTIPGGAGDLAKIYIGFDNGPNKPAKKK